MNNYIRIPPPACVNASMQLHLLVGRMQGVQKEYQGNTSNATHQMAVPRDMTVSTLKGKCNVNKTLSNTLDHLFRLQSIPYVAAKVSGLATIQLEVVVQPVACVSESNASSERPTTYEIKMKQTLMSIDPLGLAPLRALGLAPTRGETRHLDEKEFDAYEAAIGPTKGRWWLTTVDEILADNLLDDAFHKKAPRWGRCREVIRVSVRSQKSDLAKVWSGGHMWGLENHGTDEDEDLRYTARMMTWRGSGHDREVAMVKLVHDFVA